NRIGGRIDQTSKPGLGFAQMLNRLGFGLRVYAIGHIELPSTPRITHFLVVHATQFATEIPRILDMQKLSIHLSLRRSIKKNQMQGQKILHYLFADLGWPFVFQAQRCVPAINLRCPAALFVAKTTNPPVTLPPDSHTSIPPVLVEFVV